MLNRALPYFLEDRTGHLSDTEYDDIYDRMFLHVSSSSPSPPSSPTSPSSSPASQPLTITISSTPRRSSPLSHPPNTRRLSSYAQTTEPSVTLEFGGSRGALSLGSVTFSTKARRESLGMGSWVRRMSLFSGSLSRKFRASDGEEYRWVYRGVEGHEWTLLTAQSTQIAHYTLKRPSKPAYGTSGNVLAVCEAYGGIVVEVLASLIVMRCIAAYNL
ncbi:hypothetical protein BC629DRAFT_1703953 [Irpex lacteus]|nr:hypothetical protein BC629DRAFT_1703953 [Irpex lacteus]